MVTRLTRTPLAAAFEGLAHPYKANLIRSFERPKISEDPTIGSAFSQTTC